MPSELSFGANTGASAWKQMETWRAKRKAEREDFEATIATISDSFTSVMANSSQTMGTIAAQRALERLQAQTAAKQAANDKAISGTAENPSGFTALENIAARYRDIAVGTAVDVST